MIPSVDGCEIVPVRAIPCTHRKQDERPGVGQGER
jgi:hypothetical protein